MSVLDLALQLSNVKNVPFPLMVIGVTLVVWRVSSWETDGAARTEEAAANTASAVYPFIVSVGLLEILERGCKKGVEEFGRNGPKTGGIESLKKSERLSEKEVFEN